MKQGLEHRALLLGTAALALAVSGCGSGSGSGNGTAGAPSATASATSSAVPSAPGAPAAPGSGHPSAPRASSRPARPAPSAPPSRIPPDMPTDQVHRGLVTGTAMAASARSCLVLVTDDGVQYALYDPHHTTVRKAERLRVTIGPPPAKPICTAPGRQGTAITVTEVR